MEPVASNFIADWVSTVLLIKGSRFLWCPNFSHSHPVPPKIMVTVSALKMEAAISDLSVCSEGRVSHKQQTSCCVDTQCCCGS
jgi:hypothetical protein